MKKTVKNTFLIAGLLMAGAAVVLAMLSPKSFAKVFETVGMPHSHCYLNDPRMIWLHVTSDMFIGLAYVSISTTLAYMVYRARRAIPFHWMILAFGLFIVSCGFTHFMEVLTVWQPLYWLAGYVKVVTAVASVITAIALFPLVPKVFALLNAVKVSEDRRVKLMAANQELEAFASTISHDLRAPLRTMHGMAQALMEDHGKQLEPGGQFYAERILTASERMDELIRDLLNYSRMNLTEFELMPVDLKLVMDEALTMAAADIRERNANIRFEGAFPQVMASASFLSQTFSNLISNAIKFVEAGVKPEIVVTGEAHDGKVRVSVKDNGIGIAAEHQQRIFRMFERLHSVTEYPGTGVGLAIVKRVVARLGGELGLESAPGKGSTFWIELPQA
jgi:signal transduction histidine kinase